jgi:hypothetical protein
MKKSRIVKAAVGGLVLSWVGVAAEGAVVVSNLSNSVSGNSFSVQWASKGIAFVGNSFTTGSGSWTLNSVTATMREATGTNNPDIFVLTIRADAAGTPSSTVLGTLIASVNITATQANYTFAPSSSVTLTGDTQYWLVGQLTTGPTGTQYSWPASGSANYTGLTGWSIGTGPKIFNGSAWSPVNYTSTLQVGVNQFFAIDASAVVVPEPAALGLVLPVMAMGMRRRRR